MCIRDSVEVFLRVALDLRGAAPSCCDFVAELSHPISQLGLIDRCRKLLRLKKPSFLQGAGFSVASLGHVEDNNVRMKLWRDISIDWAGRIVLELGGDKPARGLWWMIAADPSLRIVFELVEGDANAFPMRFADPLIATDKRGERDRFGRGKGRIPPGPVLHRLDSLPVGILILIRRSLPNKLLAGLRMLALAQFREVLGRNGPGKAELLGQSPLPFACDDTALRPIVLFLRSELNSYHSR